MKLKIRKMKTRGFDFKIVTLKTHLLNLFFLLTIIGCNKQEESTITEPETTNSELISAVDISRYPEILKTTPTFYNLDNQEDNFLNILKDNGVNTIRLRLWVDPENEHSGFQEVKGFSENLKDLGFKVWLTLHYSDTWADPGSQVTPQRWQNIGFTKLKDSIQQYTKKVMEQINPEIVQIGNEVNSGMLHPEGNINNNQQQFIELLDASIQMVRENAAETKIMIHYAGLNGATSFYNKVANLDYDIIGLSYYPIWHGKDLEALKNKIDELGNHNGKEVIIAETAYPFTLDWNDWTNNIVGLEDQLLPVYGASPQGQKAFIKRIKNILFEEANQGLGFCYWGGELIAWKGTQSENASPWENQALFNFENKALPVLEEFRID
ncbi:arabinogalactan endo-1,4-beta-galactosidase [Flavobacteriaceae bacterium]|nr:arabinogalactan endo-1,4-beta-galactosidase [Flavobacteriaceae bacterium]